MSDNYVLLIIHLIGGLCVYFDCVRISRNCEPDDRIKHFLSPVLFFSILAYYPIYMILSREQNIIMKLLGFLMNITIISLLTYSLLLLFLPKLRKAISSQTVASFWLIPSCMYYVYRISGGSSVFKPRIVLYTDNRLACLIVALIWLSGAAFVLTRSIVLHKRFRSEVEAHSYAIRDESVLELWKSKQEKYKIRKNKQAELYESDIISSPITIGLKDPFLVLPVRSYSMEDYDQIFEHEAIHIGRKDIETKLTVIICRALNWFNPLIHKALKKCCEDLELSCDELTLIDSDAADRTHYAQLLLSSAGEDRGFSSSLAADAATMKYRLENILHPETKKNGALLLAACTVLTLSLPGLFAIGYDRQSAEEVFFKGEINDVELITHENDYLSVMPDSNQESYRISDIDRLKEIFSEIEVYELDVRLIESGDYSTLFYMQNGLRVSLIFDDRYLVFVRNNHRTAYIAKRGIKIDLLERLID